MARLVLRLFGAFELFLDDEPVTGIKSDKARALLAYLAVEANQAHRREYLAALLWPESSQFAALTSLRSALANLRKVTRDNEFAPPLFSVSAHTIQLNISNHLWIDIDEFSACVAESDSPGQLERGIACYRGPFLEGFTVADSLEFEEWALVKREQYHLQMLDGLTRLEGHYTQLKNFSAAIACARKQVEMEPWREEGHQALMRLLFLNGQRSQALSQYHACRELLGADLQIEPSLETKALYQAILEDRLDEHVWFVPDAFPEPGPPPYKGLHFFEEGDSDLFFGRERLTERLLATLVEITREFPLDSQGRLRMLSLVGASGSGKSSLVRAGLIPALKRGRPGHPKHGNLSGLQAWQVGVLTLSEHPLQDLSSHWLNDAVWIRPSDSPHGVLPGGQLDENANSWSLLVVDQFEELFTLCRDEAERGDYISRLLDLAERPVPVVLLIALRADFYAHCARYPRLREALCARQIYIGPMEVNELRAVIEEPARLGGWDVEPGLVDLILRDAGSEPGSLPLLSHALLETWGHRSGRTLTLKGYAQAGGVQGAIAKTADAVFSSLDRGEQMIARRVFLRLTEAGEDTQDTRRRASRDELVSTPEEAERVEAILNKLAYARLVTLSEDIVEVSHEALIRQWPALRGWLDEDREGLHLHRRINQAAKAWVEMDRDPAELYRGARLAQALDWVQKSGIAGELNDLEKSFLAESQAEAERQAAERELRRQRELDAAIRLAESEKQRAEVQASAAQRLRQRAWILTLSLFLVIALAGLAVYFARRNATLAGENALSAQFAHAQQATAQIASTRAVAQAEMASTQEALAISQAQARATAQAQASEKQQIAEDQARLAQAGELALAANNVLETDPELSNLLALEAVSILRQGDLPVAWDVQEALHRAVLASRLRRTWKVYQGEILSVTFSPDGRLVATAGIDGIVNILDASTGKLSHVLHGHAGTINDIAYSPEGELLATAGSDGMVRIWQVSSGRLLFSYEGHSAEVRAVAFSPDGSSAASAGADGLVKIWQASGGEDILTLSGTGYGSSDLAFNSDGSQLVVVGDDGKAVLWDALSGEIIHTILASDMTLAGVAFSPDGARLATCGEDLTTRIWNARTGELLLSMGGHRALVRQLDFSPDGTTLATASQDGTTILWDVATGLELEKLSAQAGAVNDVTFSPECIGLPENPFEGCDTRLATANRDGTLRIWDMTPAGHSELLALPGFNGMYMDDGSLLTTGWGPGGTLVVDTWGGGNRPKDWRTASINLSGFSAPVIAGSYSPDRSRLVTVTQDGNAQFWDRATSDLLSAFPLSTHSASINAIDLSMDNIHLATASDDGSARVWDANTGKEILALLGHTEYVWGVAFSPDGSRLATAGTDGTVRIWDSYTGAALMTLNASAMPINTVVFSLDGSRLASAGMDGSARVWEANTGELLRELEGHSATVISAAFSPDGSRLATGSYDGTLKIWDISDGNTSGQALLTLAAPAWPTWLAFDSSGTRLVKGSYQDMNVQVYALDIAELAEIARSRVTRSLSVEECRKYLRLEECP